MTYGISHLLIGVCWGGGLFSGGGSRKNIALKRGGHYMKIKLHENKNVGGCVLSTQPDQQKRTQCKNAQKKMQKIIKH